MTTKGKNCLLFTLLGLSLILVLVVLVLEGVCIWILFQEVGKLKSKMVPQDTTKNGEGTAVKPRMNQDMDISNNHGTYYFIIIYINIYIHTQAVDIYIRIYIYNL